MGSSRIEVGYGDSATWGSIWHPDDPRAATGLDCPDCGADLDADDLCVNRCNPNPCTDLFANQLLFEKLLLKLSRLERYPDPISVGGIIRFPDRPAEVQEQIDHLDRVTDDLLDRIPCRSDGSACDEIEQRPQDLEVAAEVARFELALGVGEILDDRDTLMVLVEQLRQRGELGAVKAIQRTLERAGMLPGPNEQEEEEEHEADLATNVEPAPESGVIGRGEENLDAHG